MIFTANEPPPLRAFTTATALAEHLASHCEGAHSEHDGAWRAKCPAHGGKGDTSLHITPKGDKVLLKCFGGCETAAILALWDMTLTDLFLTPRYSNGTSSGTPGPVLATYDYHDAHGTLLYQVRRHAPKEFRPYHPHPTRPGQWEIGLGGIQPVLYRLPHILEAVAQGRTIYVPEGERDCNALVALGLDATTNQGGADKWHATYSESLRGANVVICQDNDPAGAKHTAKLTASLQGMAASIKVLTFPTLPPKGDVSDWLAAGYARTDLEALVEQTPLWTPGSPTVEPSKPDTDPWAQAITAQDFLAQEDQDPVAHAKDLIIPGAITLVSAPRGSGKSLVALSLAVALATGGVFRGEQLLQKRVLLVDRDNPPSLVRKRLRWLGAHTVTGLKVLTRDKAPPLTDKASWQRFPVDTFDVIIIDSVGSSTEGVAEREGKETQLFLATMKDLAYRGPAILGLDNTNKNAANIRGRGEKSDAADIVYEARNVTGWTPSQGGNWWESLPEYGEHTWQQRASRQQGQKVLRIAFIPSKFRLGVEPEPFALEIDTQQDPWTLTDVTTQIASTGEDNAREVRSQARRTLEDAAKALVTYLQLRVPTTNPLVKSEGEAFLQRQGLSRKQARLALEDGFNKDVHPQEGLWHIRPLLDQRGSPLAVVLPCQLVLLSNYSFGKDYSGGNNTKTKSSSNSVISTPSISADGSTSGGENSSVLKSNIDADCRGADLRRGLDSDRRKSETSTISNGVSENDVRVFPSPQNDVGVFSSPQQGIAQIFPSGEEVSDKKNTKAKSPSNGVVSAPSISADGPTLRGGNTLSTKPSIDADFREDDFRHGLDSGRRKSDVNAINNGAGENGVGLFPPPRTLQESDTDDEEDRGVVIDDIPSESVGVDYEEGEV